MAPSFGTYTQYLSALKTLENQGIQPYEKNILLAHYRSRNATSSWSALAPKAGFANGDAVNLHYGKFAHRVAKLLGVSYADTGRFWLYVLVDWAEKPDNNGFLQFRLRPEVRTAIRELGWESVRKESKSSDHVYPDELDAQRPYFEGACRKITVNAYERDTKARKACIKHYGYRCAACNLDFAERYGALGKNFIHVHHIVPLANIGKKYTVNPVKDLIPVCPNCHAMLHRTKEVLTIDELKKRVKNR